MNKRKFKQNETFQKRVRRLNVYNPYETGSKIVYKKAGWDYTFGTVKDFMFHPHSRLMKFKIQGPSIPGCKIVHEVIVPCIDSEREGYDYELSPTEFYFSDDIPWFRTWREDVKIGQKLVDLCPLFGSDRNTFVVATSVDTIFCQSSVERHVRKFKKNSLRIIPKVRRLYDGTFAPVVLQHFELPPTIYPEREMEDQYLGSMCILNNQECHVIDVDYDAGLYCVIFDQQLHPQGLIGWMQVYQTHSDNFAIEWVKKEVLELVEPDVVKSRVSNALESADLTFDMEALLTEDAKSIEQIFNMGDAEYAFDLLQRMPVFPFSFRSIPRHFPMMYCHFLDHDGEVWRNMWLGRFGYDIPWLEHVDMSVMQYVRSIPMFSFELVGFKCHNRKPATATLRVKYNNVYTKDVRHLSPYRLTRVSNVLMQRIYNYSYPTNVSLTYKDAVKDQSNKVKLEDLQLMDRRNIPSLKGYQEFMVNKMIQSENSKEYLTTVFTRRFDGFHYNDITGFGDTCIPNANGGILSLGTGLGKTIIVIELLLRVGGKTLIVVPTGILSQWRSELRRFAPEVKTTEFYLRKRDTTGDVVLTTYKMLSNSYLELISLPMFDRIVFDESHQLKGMRTQTLQACSRLNARNRWCLTATPCDDVLSLTPQLAMLQVYPFTYRTDTELLQNIWLRDRGMFGKLLQRIVFEISEAKLEELGVNPLSHVQQSEEVITVPLCSHVQKLVSILVEKYQESFEFITHREVQEIIRTLNLTSIDHSLVPLYMFGHALTGRDGVNEATVDEIVQNVDASDRGTTAYREEIKQKLMKYSEENNEDTCVVCLEPFTERTLTPCFHSFCKNCIVDSLKFKDECPACRAPCTTSSLIQLVKDREEKHEGYSIVSNACGKRYKVANEVKEVYDHQTLSEKFKWVLKKLQALKESTVVFSSYTCVLRKLQMYLRANDVQAAFMKTDVDSSVYLLSTRMASVGINLANASNIVFLEPILNEETRVQSVGRIRRIGQKRNIRVYTLQFDNGIEPIYTCLKHAQDDYINDTLRKQYIGKRFKMQKKNIRRQTLRKVLEGAMLWANAV